MKKQLLLLILIAFSIASEISAQTNTSNNSTTAVQPTAVTSVDQSNLPADYPTFINTGDPEKDRITYKEAVAAWTAKHEEENKSKVINKPEDQGTNTEVNKTTTSTTKASPVLRVDGKVILTKADFEKLDADKQANIKAHPESYTILE